MTSKFLELNSLFKELVPADDQAQLVIYIAGEKVVDDATGVDPDQLLPIYSVSKALSAIVVAKVVEYGLLDLEKPVSHYWPEFAANGKSEITVRQLFSHQAGLPETRARLTPDQLRSDHEAAALLASERPLWAPGKAFGYHGITIGNLISEVIFRVTGSTVQEYFEREVRTKTNADAYLGLPKDLHHRFLPSLPAKDPALSPNPRSLNNHVFATFIDACEPTKQETSYLFSTAGLEFGQPAAGGVASARGLAEIFNWATGYGGNQAGINAAVLEDFSQVQVYGYDLVLDQPNISFGTIFMKPTVDKPYGSIGAFGHNGAAGAWLFADPANEIVFSYVVRRFSGPEAFNSRILPIINKLHQIIGM